MPDWRSFVRERAPTRTDVLGTWEKARELLRRRREPEEEAEPTYYTRREIFDEVKNYIDAYKKGEANIEDFYKFAQRVSPEDRTFAQMALDVVKAYSVGKGNLMDFYKLAKMIEEVKVPGPEERELRPGPVPFEPEPQPPPGEEGEIIGKKTLPFPTREHARRWSEWRDTLAPGEEARMPDRGTPWYRYIMYGEELPTGATRREVPTPEERELRPGPVPFMPEPRPAPFRRIGGPIYSPGRGLSNYPRLPQSNIPTPRPEYEAPGRPKKRPSFLNPFAWRKARKLWW